MVHQELLPPSTQTESVEPSKNKEWELFIDSLQTFFSETIPPKDVQLIKLDQEKPFFCPENKCNDVAKTYQPLIFNYRFMKKLEKYYKKYGYHLNQIFRDNNTAIYKQSDDERAYGFEVFEIKTAKEGMVFNKLQPAREVYPSSEQFGQFAFSVNTIVRAEETIELLKERIKARESAAAPEAVPNR